MHFRKLIFLLLVGSSIGILTSCKNQEANKTDNAITVDAHNHEEEKPTKEIDTSTPLSNVVLSSNKLDFNSIPRDKPVTGHIVLTNRNPNAIDGVSVNTTCGCLEASISKKSMNPGDTALITVTYDAKIPGLFQKDVYVNYNGQSEVIMIEVSGHTLQ